MKKKFICTQSHYGSKPAICRWAMLDEKGWIDGETPIEDCGMFLILDKEISPESAARLFIALLGHVEGERPEVKQEITKHDQLFRSVYLPGLLTPEEFEIFQELTK